MGDFVKVSDEVFEHRRKDGISTYKRETVHVIADLSNVQRVAVGGNERTPGTDDEQPLKFERHIHAEWMPDDYYFELISTDRRPLTKPSQITITQEEFKYSRAHHFERNRYSDEALFFSFYLPEQWFNWLWDRIGEQPTAPVQVRFQIALFLMGIEAHNYYDVGFNPIRLEANHFAPITDAKFSIGIRKTEKPIQHKQKGIKEQFEDELESGDPGVWARRIFWVLILIAAVLYFKH